MRRKWKDLPFERYADEYAFAPSNRKIKQATSRNGRRARAVQIDGGKRTLPFAYAHE
jgi:hypothetical protein